MSAAQAKLHALQNLRLLKHWVGGSSQKVIESFDRYLNKRAKNQLKLKIEDWVYVNEQPNVSKEEI